MDDPNILDSLHGMTLSEAKPVIGRIAADVIAHIAEMKSAGVLTIIPEEAEREALLDLLFRASHCGVIVLDFLRGNASLNEIARRAEVANSHESPVEDSDLFADLLREMNVLIVAALSGRGLSISSSFVESRAAWPSGSTFSLHAMLTAYEPCTREDDEGQEIQLHPDRWAMLMPLHRADERAGKTAATMLVRLASQITTWLDCLHVLLRSVHSQDAGAINAALGGYFISTLRLLPTALASAGVTKLLCYIDWNVVFSDKGGTQSR